MSKRKHDVRDFYRNVLDALKFTVEDDLITEFNPRQPRPAVVSKKRLAFPSPKLLRDGLGDDLIAFHPLSESIARRSVSPVLQYLQGISRAVLVYYLCEISQQLMKVAADKTLHRHLSPKGVAFLKKVSNADKRTFTVFEKLLEAAGKKNRLAVVYLRPNGKIGKTEYSRVCIVRFPFLEDLKSDEDHPLGVRMSKRQRQTLIALFEYIIPGGEKLEGYSAGSNSREAPFLDALLRAYANVAEQLNRILELHGKEMEMGGENGCALEPLDLDYLPQLELFDEYYRQIDALDGNVGSIKELEEETTETQVTAPAPRTAASVSNTPPPPPASRGSASAPAKEETAREMLQRLRNPYGHTPAPGGHPPPPPPQHMPMQQANPYAQPFHPAPAYGHPPAYGQPPVQHMPPPPPMPGGAPYQPPAQPVRGAGGHLYMPWQVPAGGPSPHLPHRPFAQAIHGPGYNPY